MDMKTVTSTNHLQQYPGMGKSDGDATASNEKAAIETGRNLLHKNRFQLTIADEALVKAIEKANKALDGTGTRFEYSVHEKTNDIIVKVINKDTNEVIREIPSEKLLDLVAKLQEICGVIIDEKR